MKARNNRRLSTVSLDGPPSLSCSSVMNVEFFISHLCGNGTAVVRPTDRRWRTPSEHDPTSQLPFRKAVSNPKTADAQRMPVPPRSQRLLEESVAAYAAHMTSGLHTSIPSS